MGLIINPYRFAAAGGGGGGGTLPARWWRARSDDLPNGPGFMGCSELQMRAVSGGSDLTTGKTAFADATYNGYVPAQAIDDNTATFWTTANISPGAHFIGVDFGAGNEQTIVEMTYRQRGDGIREDPNNLFFEYSNDSTTGTDGTWITYWSVTGIGSWTNGETKTFTKP